MVSTNQDLDIRYALPHLAFANPHSSLRIELGSHLLLIHAYSIKSTTTTQNHGVPFRTYLFLIPQNLWLGFPPSTTYSSSWYAFVHILSNIKAHTLDNCSKSCHWRVLHQTIHYLTQADPLYTISFQVSYECNLIFCSPPSLTSFTYQEAFRVHSGSVWLSK